MLPVIIRLSVCGPLLLLILNGAPVYAQAEPEGQPSYSYLDDLPLPPLMEGVGASTLEITTTSDQAQRYFNQGLSLLHDFWELEAYRAFKAAAHQDSLAVMAHWGLYQALQGYKERTEERAAALDKMKRLQGRASDHEQYYVRAWILRDSLGASEGKEAYERELEALIIAYPDDVEAHLFLARSLGWRYDADGRPREGTAYAVSILRGLLESHPTHHGVHHYWIHAVETKYPARAQESAEALARLAPRSGHIVHMPGHLFYTLGDYDKAREAFLAAHEVEQQYRADQGIALIDNPMEIHNLHYLVVALAEGGRYEEARRWAQHLGSLTASEDRHGATGIFSLYYQARVIPGKLALRFGDWAAAAEHFEAVDAEDPLFSENAPAAKSYRKVWLSYARGRAALKEGVVEEAQAHAQALDATLWQDEQADELEAFGGWIKKQLRAASLELQGLIQSQRGAHDQAIDLLTRAVEAEQSIGVTEPPYYIRPARESLAQAYIRADRWDEAQATYDALLAQRPNSGHALYGRARAYEQAGEQGHAQQAYAAFLRAWANADATLPQMQHARSQVRGTLP